MGFKRCAEPEAGRAIGGEKCTETDVFRCGTCGRFRKADGDIRGKTVSAPSGETADGLCIGCFREKPGWMKSFWWAAPGETEYCRRQIVEKYGIEKVARIVEGEQERYDSVYAGLQASDRDLCIDP